MCPSILSPPYQRRKNYEFAKNGFITTREMRREQDVEDPETFLPMRCTFFLIQSNFCKNIQVYKTLLLFLLDPRPVSNPIQETFVGVGIGLGEGVVTVVVSTVSAKRSSKD